MEIVLIEKKTYENLLLRIDRLHGKLKDLDLKYGSKCIGRWYDNQDVCLILRISQRKLQSLRDGGHISFSQINHKIYYKAEDIENYLKLNSKPE